MHAESKAKAQGVDLVDDRIHVFPCIAQHVQHGAKDFAAKILYLAHLNQRRGHKVAIAAFRWQLQANDLMALVLHGSDVGFNVGHGLRVNDGAHVGAQLVRIAHAQLLHGTLQHVQHMVCAVFLQAQQAQGRAALTCRVIGRLQYIAHHLLGQGRRIDHHGVDAASLGNQWHRLAMAAQALRQRAVNVLGHGVGAGKHHGVGIRMGHQCLADGFAFAGQQLQRMGRNASLVQQLHGLRGNQAGLLGRLGNHCIARSQRRGKLPGKDGQRKIPGADADHHAERAV